jgi:hypothetical protein
MSNAHVAGDTRLDVVRSFAHASSFAQKSDQTCKSLVTLALFHHLNRINRKLKSNHHIFIELLVSTRKEKEERLQFLLWIV